MKRILELREERKKLRERLKTTMTIVSQNQLFLRKKEDRKDILTRWEKDVEHVGELMDLADKSLDEETDSIVLDQSGLKRKLDKFFSDPYPDTAINVAAKRSFPQ